MYKVALLCCALCAITGVARGQFARSGALRLGTGWLPETVEDDFGNRFRASEWSTTASAEVRLGPGITVGPLVRHTRTKGSTLVVTETSNTYWSYGGHLGYVRDLGWGFTGGLGATYVVSDFCSCGDDLGYRRAGTRYVGVLARGSYALTEVLSVEAAVTLQRALGDVEDAFGYNFGTLGLALEFPGYNRRLDAAERR